MIEEFASGRLQRRMRIGRFRGETRGVRFGKSKKARHDGHQSRQSQEQLGGIKSDGDIEERERASRQHGGIFQSILRGDRLA